MRIFYNTSVCFGQNRYIFFDNFSRLSWVEAGQCLKLRVIDPLTSIITCITNLQS